MIRNRSVFLIGALLLVVAGLSCWGLVVRADRLLRQEFLHQLQDAAENVRLDQVQALEGTEDDLAKLEYGQLKEQFQALRRQGKDYRFVYLLGNADDGSLIFLVDDLTGGHPEGVAAGQKYPDAPQGFVQVLRTGSGAVIGPFFDARGNFVSAAVPLGNDREEKRLALLVMGMEAADWRRAVGAKAALPVGLILVAVAGILTSIFLLLPSRSSSKPVLRRLLPPLLIMVAALLIGTGGLLWFQHTAHTNRQAARLKAAIAAELQVDLRNQGTILALALESISADPRLLQGLESRDPELLLEDWQPVFERLRRDHDLTHFNFIDQDRSILLRLQRPQWRGDRAENFVVRQAERSGRTASGVDIGRTGILALRVAQPVYRQGQRLGYVELGKDIGGLLQERYVQTGSHLAVTLAKDHIERRQWQEAMVELGRENDWERLADSVIVYASQGRLPEAFLPLARPDGAGEHLRHRRGTRIVVEGRHWQVNVLPFRNAAGAVVGCLLLMTDVTAERVLLAQTLVLGGASGAVVLISLLGMILVLLRRTDAEMQNHQAGLRRSEERLQSIFRIAPTGIGVVCERVFLEVNDRFCEMTGFAANELVGRNARMLYPDQAAYEAVGEQKHAQIAARGTCVVETRWRRRDGRVIDVLLASTPLCPEDPAQGETFVALDITDRKSFEKALRESEARYRSLFENNHAVMLIVDPVSGEVVDANPAAAAWYGWSREQLCQKNISEINTLDPEEVQKAINRARLDKGGHFFFQHRRADGSLRDVEVFSGPVTVAGRSLLYSIIHDITEKKKAEAALENRLLALTRPLDDAAGVTFEELFNLEDIQRLQDDFSRATDVASMIVAADGTPITAPSNFTRLCRLVRSTAQGRAECARSDAFIGRPSTDGPNSSRCLSAGFWDAGAAILLDGHHIASWIIGQVRDEHHSEEQIRVYARRIGVDEESMVEAFRQVPMMSEARFQAVAQALFTITRQLSLSAYQNVQQARFISEQKAQQEKITFLAHHDQLTGLANRTLLAQRFALAAAHARRAGSGLALCVIDLDNFKVINDTYGHALGDQLLCEVAGRLRHAVRVSDTVCRVGGDEFVILFTDLQEEGAITVLIRKIQLCFEPSFLIADAHHPVTPSMGVAIFPEDGQEFSTLFENADAAMYFAKESGRNNAQFFRAEIHQRVQHRLTLEKELRQALLAGELELHYQPIVRLPEQGLAGLEAMIRWRHPERGLLPPGQFIPVAEESRLIVALGRWILDAACADMAAWRNREMPIVPVSVNVSARQLFDSEFAGFVEKTLAKWKLPPQQLELEVTENIFLENSEVVEAVMNRLKNIGIGLILDDFGTGYSSLSYLKRFRIEKLKIDRSFMDQVCTDSQDAMLVKTIIDMARNLGMKVVAEGVETIGQRDFLLEGACELAQGFFFSRPLPPESTQKLLEGSKDVGFRIQESAP